VNQFCGIEILGDDDSLLERPPEEVVLANGIGAMPGSELRMILHQRMIDKGYGFTTVIHPSAIVAADVEIAKGAQLMAGTVIQPGVRIGSSCIINTGVTVDHDCNIHSHCHLAPGVTLSGSVEVNQGTHIGTGASVIQGIVIGQNCVIAAGSIIYSDVSDNTRHIQSHEPFQAKE
jgi:UDP-perosamine 4-acetyltransferase